MLFWRVEGYEAGASEAGAMGAGLVEGSHLNHGPKVLLCGLIGGS